MSEARDDGATDRRDGGAGDAPREAAAEPRREGAGAAAGGNGGGNGDLLEVDHLRVLFPIRAGTLVARVVAHVHAVDDVSLVLHEGETLGIVGESGCGKSTLIRALMRLVDSTGGSLHFRGVEITRAGRRELAPVRRELQMVFQDPQASLNPRKRVGQIVGLPLRLRGVPDVEARSR